MLKQHLTIAIAVAVCCVSIADSAHAQALNVPFDAFPGDLNRDGKVDVVGDGFILLGNLGMTNATTSDGDIVGNSGKINVNDSYFFQNVVLGTTNVGPGDLNGDGVVDVIGDGHRFVNNFGKLAYDPTNDGYVASDGFKINHRVGDLNYDGIIDLLDYDIIVENLGNSYPNDE